MVERLAAGLLLLSAVAVQAGESALEIMEKVWHVNHFLSVDNIQFGSRRHPLVLVNLSADGRVQRYTMERHLNNAYSKGDLRARDLIIFRSGKLRGTALLVDLYRDPERPLRYAIWLPALRKVRRHSEPDPAERWGGSVFTHGDIYLRRPGDERHELVGEEIFGGCLGMTDRPIEGRPEASCHPRGRPVWRIRSHTRFHDWWYDYRETWVDKETFADYRAIYYKDGRPIKVIDKDWRSMGLDDPRALYGRYLYGKDLLTGNESLTWATPDQVRWNQPVKAEFWSLATLRRIRR